MEISGITYACIDELRIFWRSTHVALRCFLIEIKMVFDVHERHYFNRIYGFSHLLWTCLVFITLFVYDVGYREPFSFFPVS